MRSRSTSASTCAAPARAWPAASRPARSGRWWNGDAVARSQRLRSRRWFETMAGDRRRRAGPTAQRNSRSFRQWPCWLTISSRRGRARQRVEAAPPCRTARARGANSASSVAASARCGGASKCTRMKNRPVRVVALHVAELLRVDDVAAGLVQQPRHRVDDALGVAARQRQDEFVAGWTCMVRDCTDGALH